SAKPGERLPDIGAAIMEHRRRVPPETPLMRQKARHHPPSSIENMGVGAGKDHPLRPGITLGVPGIRLVEPDTVEELHQWEIEDIDPDDRLEAVVAVVVPGTVRRQD